MTSSKLKHLNFDEMWKLYKTIKEAMPEKDEKYIIHEVINILDNLTDKDFKDSLKLLGFVYNQDNPVKIASFFIKGLNKNKFFQFHEFIQRLL